MKFGKVVVCVLIVLVCLGCGASHLARISIHLDVAANGIDSMYLGYMDQLTVEYHSAMYGDTVDILNIEPDGSFSFKSEMFVEKPNLSDTVLIRIRQVTESEVTLMVDSAGKRVVLSRKEVSQQEYDQLNCESIKMLFPSELVGVEKFYYIRKAQILDFGRLYRLGDLDTLKRLNLPITLIPKKDTLQCPVEDCPMLRPDSLL